MAVPEDVKPGGEAANVGMHPLEFCEDAGVPGRGLYLNENACAKPISRTRSSVAWNSSSVSPGKPTMMSVLMAMSRFDRFIHSIRRMYSSRLYSRCIRSKIRVDPD